MYFYYHYYYYYLLGSTTYDECESSLLQIVTSTLPEMVFRSLELVQQSGHCDAMYNREHPVAMLNNGKIQ